ncbi:putative inorganic phosphate cotransporter [Amphibalanus amphitrite]|uniref:putative inorganic phosphate cotransporter n=1 Tax=Amphibalanus amphitrite TaxID=1232801 RepID=UPI001C90E237|nr:putative inorganic phosphate cotransporter [Amphibalanus amphitrite]
MASSMPSSETSPTPTSLELKSAMATEQQYIDGAAAGARRCGQPPVRLLVLFLVTGGFMVQMMLRVTLSVAMVAMVNHTAIPHAEVSAQAACSNWIAADSAAAPPPPEHDDTEVGEYVWDEFTQGLLLAAFYWGYLVTQVPGGFLAERFGSKRVLGVSQGLNGALALLLPVAADGGPGWVIAVRFIQGVCCGPVYPCLFPLVARWFPLDERQRAFSFVNAMTAFGISLTTTMAGQLSTSLGWRSVFYTSGSIALLWAAAWMLLVHDTPHEHPSATEAERRRIGAGNVTSARTVRRPPYGAILRSAPVLAIIIAETANSWSLTYLMTSLPTYMKHVLGFDLRANGVLSGLPLVCRGLMMLTGGSLADLALRRGWLRVVTIRRLAAGLSSGGCALLLFLVTFVGCQPAVATLFVCLAGTFNGLVTIGTLLNPLDIAPNYSGSVFGIANLIGNGISTLNPVATGAMIRGEQTAERWNNVFYLGAGIFAVNLVVYQALMSADRQPWDKQEDGERAGNAGGVGVFEEVNNRKAAEATEERQGGGRAE